MGGLMQNQIISTQTNGGLDVIIDLLQNLTAEFSAGYIIASTVLSIIVGILAAAFVILAATLSKKNIVFGIIAGIFQIFGAVGVQKYAHVFLEMEKFAMIQVTGSSQADVNQKLQEAMTEYMMNMLGDLIIACICGALMFAAWLMGLIFIIMSMRNNGKALVIIALLLHIGRYLFALPYDMVSPLVLGQPITDISQLIFDFLYYGATLLPFLLVMISGIITGIKSKKQAQAQ